VTLADRRPGDPAVLVASAARATAQLGWQPRHRSLDAIIASAWSWMVRHGLSEAA
jgi:UDP-glucose 4-epimerase